jgi:hypothetical protein
MKRVAKNQNLINESNNIKLVHFRDRKAFELKGVVMLHNVFLVKNNFVGSFFFIQKNKKNRPISDIIL